MVQELRNSGIIGRSYSRCVPLVGGSYSIVGALSRGDSPPTYVVKATQPHLLGAEVEFLQTYQGWPVPELLYVAPGNRYIVYRYLPGGRYTPGKKAQLLQSLTDCLFNRYEPIPNPAGWGWRWCLVDSWEQFLLDRLAGHRTTLGATLAEDDYVLVARLARQPYRRHPPRQAFLLHGDCGVRNCLFHGADLSGVIDPTPVIGLPIYDLVYTFCSTPDDLTLDVLMAGASMLKTWTAQTVSALQEEVLLALYCRIATCIEFHKQDLPLYMEAWTRWRAYVLSHS